MIEHKKNGESLISIIIPLYNNEQYLEQCLVSVINQTYQNIQIVIVNDGSRDESGSICARFAEKDCRIQLISKNNEGVSIARNVGLMYAKGDYVCFIDSDDYVDQNFVRELYELIIQKNGCNLAICGYTEFSDKAIIGQTTGECETLNQKQAYEKLYRTDSFRGYVCNKIFVREIIEKNHLQFSTSISVWEDVLFVSEYLRFCNYVIYNPCSYYYYRYHELSASHNQGNIKKAMDVLQAQIMIDDQISSELISVKEIIAKRILLSSIDAFRTFQVSKSYSLNMIKEVKGIINRYKKVGKKNLALIDRIKIFICYRLHSCYFIILRFNK